MRVHIPVPLRWLDLDAYGMVNNAIVLTLLEEARIGAFWTTDGIEPSSPLACIPWSPQPETMTLMVGHEIEYASAILYRQAPLDVELWLGRIGGSSLEVCYEVWSPIGLAPRTLHVVATTTMIIVDGTTRRSRRISDHERARWSPYLEAPVTPSGHPAS